MRGSILVAVALGFSAMLGGGELLPSDTSLEASESTDFREIGSFQVSSAFLTQLGKTTEIPKGDLILRVFTDGIDIRISPEGEDEDFLAFQIYYNGDIFDATGENLIPGVKALSDQGEVLRSITVTAQLLTIVKLPTLTNDVEITYATRYER